MQFSETTWKLSFLTSREISFQWAAYVITGHRNNCFDQDRDETSEKQNRQKHFIFATNITQTTKKAYFKHRKTSEAKWFNPCHVTFQPFD
jgi:hypothetical protein